MKDCNEDQIDNKRVIEFIIIGLIIIIIGVAAVLYFYNNGNNVHSSSGTFTDLTQLSLKNNETKDVTVNGKRLSIKLKDNAIYLNNKKIYSSDINIENVSNNIIVTNRMILIANPGGQFGTEYSFYDLNGNEIKYIGKDAQFRDIKIEDKKLKVNAFIFENQWMGGYKIGNILTVDGAVDCNGKQLKDYPSVVEGHKNDVLKADYYFYLSGNELTLKYDKVLTTVGDLDLNTCVMEDDSNQNNNFDVTKLTVENGYSEITLNNEEKQKINTELVKEFKPGSSANPIITGYGNYEIYKNVFANDCNKLGFVEWYIYHNNNSNYEIKQYMVKAKDESGNEFDKIKYNRLLDIAKEVFNVQNASCNSSEQFKADVDGYVWLSPFGGGYIPTTMKILAKYKNDDNYYLIIHMYEDGKCMESVDACAAVDDNPNVNGNSKYIKLKYGTNGEKKYLISFEYLN